MVDPWIAAFVRDTLLPAYSSIASPRMRRDYSVSIYDDAIDDPLHATLVAELHRAEPGGPALLIEELDPARRPGPFGGRFLVAPTFRESGETLVSPVVMFQMQFDRELHVFRQRYAALSEIAIERVTGAMIQNHVLNSFSFYRANAFSPTRPW
jgi:hypothetical protein